MSARAPRSCAECGSPLDAAQSYCLVCGERAGAPGTLLEELKRRAVRQGPRQAPPQLQAPHLPRAPLLATPASAAAPSRAPRRALPLPPAKVWALLAIVFLGFGLLMGATVGSPPKDALAASARRLDVVLAPTATAPTSTATSTGEASPPSAGEAETPASESTPTPEAPSEATKTATSAPRATRPATQPAAGSPQGKSRPSGEGTGAGPATKLPPIKHVFVIMLSDQPYAAAFGPVSPAHYLAGTLERRGTLLVRYDAVAHEELANEIALISGQGPTPQTAANCPTYADVVPSGVGAAEQILGAGCVYPRATQTLPGELAAKHLTWKAYVQGNGEGAGACAHPLAGQNDPSANQAAGSGPYATFRNPFVYFHSIVDSPKCPAEDVGLGALQADLRSPARTPNLLYIAPDRCDDGNPTPCTTGAPAGLLPADAFLEQVVPEIIRSRAYKQNGLIVITVDQAPSSGELADSSACCGQPSFPNLAPSAAAGLSPRGGGSVGALLLSPYLKGGVTSQEPYNDFSLLQSFEDFFGVKHLGYAALPTVKPLEAAMFTATRQR